MNNIKNTFRAGLAMAAGLVAMYSCTDSWNDHYNAEPSLVYDGTTMQAIQEQASDFAKVVKAYGYERELSSENIYTIWAPANGTFNVSDYVDGQGKAIADSAEVVKQFIKNHIARYSVSYNGQDKSISLLNEKGASMTSDGKFGSTNITKNNIACKNGVIHIIDSASPYNFNLFEIIAKQYKDDTEAGKDTLSLYSFLYDAVNNKDSLIEDKSVSRGVDENGDKIWVDSFVLRNNTVLKNVDAKLYEEDSSFIAILPTAKAWAERYKKAASLLQFNPNEDAKAEGACDSLQRHYANHFAMTDLFYNKNANEHWQDSLKSTNYSGRDWQNNVYYSKMPKYMPEDKKINDILSKCGTPIECSNGTAYIVDEYPMSPVEQFFKKVRVRVSSSSIDQTLDSKSSPAYTKNVSTAFRTYSGTLTSYITDSLGERSSYTSNYNYVDFVPSSGSVNPYIAIQIPNTLSGTYDIYVVTCPIWLQVTTDSEAENLDTRPYRFYAHILERDDKGVYPSSGVRLANPDGSGNYFVTNGFPTSEDGYVLANDTTYLGQYTFKNAYYGRNDEGVLLQLQSQVTSKLTKDYSREILFSSVILKPHDEDSAEEPVVLNARKRSNKEYRGTIINQRK